MYDRFIFALEKYQRTGWTIEQVTTKATGGRGVLALMRLQEIRTVQS